MSEENPNPKQYPLGEPSVLDYVKSLFRFGNGERIHIPSLAEEEFRTVAVQVEEIAPQPIDEAQPSSFLPPPSTPFPWRSLLALLVALAAQNFFEPAHTSIELGLALYVGAFACLGWAIQRGEWTLPPHAPTSDRTDPLTVRFLPFISAALLFWLAYILLGGSQLIPGFSLPDSIVSYLQLEDNKFTGLNFSIWLLTIGFLLWGLWLGPIRPRLIFGKLNSLLRFNLWTILLIAATALVLFFRFYQTASVPPEPFSDHAEKILDVYEVSQGQTSIFFQRNTGREGFQMYWTLLIAKVFGTGFSFMSLKLGTAILGFLTLPFIYLLGKEVGGARVGLIAFILAGIGYWPNVISRVGLRFPLYPLFAAPVLLYLLRGLRTRNRNDFLLAGLFLGIGLHGYSPIRIVPFVVVAAFLLYWLHSQS
ncbi:MAG: glycosyltransferase family 39 protein [Anaerolineales bacterium]